MYNLLLGREFGICKLVLVFVLGAFIGNVIETIFCWMTSNKLMNRSNYIFLPLSAVWGGAFLLASVMYYWVKDLSVLTVFILSILLGTLYEYFYSVVLEHIFAVKFWDYSGFRFHINGRVNLLYSIGWGIAGILWVKVIYPILNMWINRLSSNLFLAISLSLLAVLLADTIISVTALKRYAIRNEETFYSNKIYSYIDDYFTDSYMEEVFPYMSRVESQ